MKATAGGGGGGMSGAWVRARTPVDTRRMQAKRRRVVGGGEAGARGEGGEAGRPRWDASSVGV